MEHIRLATESDLDYVCTHMRPEDIEEVVAAGWSPYDALRVGFENGLTYTLIDPEGNPAGLLGVSFGGLIWLLGTPSIERYSVTFLRHSRPVLKRLYDETGAELLWNRTYIKNTVHHKWLKWLGFTFIREVGDFYEFAKLRGTTNV